MLKDKVRFESEGLCWKNHFRLLVEISSLFSCTDDFVWITEEITSQSCAENHTKFLQKCSKPLWFNEEFFIKLPFKKNEDVNPTKATHFGMHPDHQQLVEQELFQLKQQGIVEDMKSS